MLSVAREGPHSKGRCHCGLPRSTGAEGTPGNERAIHLGAERDSFRVWPPKPPIEFSATTREAGGPALEPEPPEVLIPLASWAPTSLCSAAPPQGAPGGVQAAAPHPPCPGHRCVCARGALGNLRFSGWKMRRALVRGPTTSSGRWLHLETQGTSHTLHGAGTPQSLASRELATPSIYLFSIPWVMPSPTF